jgi:DNA-binding NarL/FixJ family response regulator
VRRKVKVLLADDHRLMIEGVRMALEADGGFDVVGATTQATEVMALIEQCRPELVILDVRMPVIDGIAVLKMISSRHPDVVSVILSAFEDPIVMESALDNGAASFVLKHIDPQDLGDVLRQAMAGVVFRSPTRFPAQSTAAIELGLTPKETEILGLLALGLSNPEIARRLWIAEPTVKFHLTKIYRKLGVGNRTSAVRVAHARGLVANPMLQEA